MAVETKVGIRPRQAQMGALAGIAVACLIVIAYLASEVSGKLHELETSRTDNVHYTMSQLEIEYLDLSLALRGASEQSDANALGALRRRFNVVYSRIATLRDGPAYLRSLETSGTTGALTDLAAGIERMVPVMDGSDAELITALPRLAGALDGFRGNVRIISLSGNRAWVKHTEAARADVAWVLQQVALAIVVLVGDLIWLMQLFWRLYKVNKRRARENQETLARLSTIIATSQDAIVVLDAEGQISDFNGAAQCIFGRSSDEAATAGLGGLLCRGPDTDTPVPVTATDLRAACADGPRTGWRMTGCHSEGRHFPVELSLDTASRRGETITVCFIRDISRRVKAEQDMARARDLAQESERTKARFLAVMSHEMRTPLNGILGAIDLIGASGTEPAQRPYLEVMQNSGQQLLQHVNDVLDIAQIEAAGVRLNAVGFDLDRLIDDLIRTECPKATARGTQLRRDTGTAPMGRVVGDAGRVHQILLNLVTNAIKFTEGGQVTVAASRITTGAGGHLVELRISDNGIGIPDDQRRRIFEDFVRLDQAVIGRTEGTGLGLGIVQRLVQAMDGQIEVDSHEGKGSQFSVRLPLPAALDGSDAPLPRQADTPHLSAPAAAMARRILIVEDNPTNRFITREMLRRDGHRVDEAENGVIGVGMATDTAYDLILMDVSMPVMDGLDATRQIREGKGASARSTIIALTAHIHIGIDADMVRAGFTQVLTKPLRWQALRDVLAREAGPAQQPSQPAEPDDTVVSAVVTDMLDTLPNAQGQKLIAAFLAEGDRFVAGIAGMDGLPLPELEARIHAFAGSAATFGAAAMHRALARAERAAHGDDRPGALRELSDLDEIWMQTQVAYQARRAHP